MPDLRDMRAWLSEETSVRQVDLILVAAAALVAVLVLILGLSRPAAASEELEVRACPGIVLALFEARIGDDVKLWRFEGKQLAPFEILWRAKRRPQLPLQLERVTVYSAPGRPFLVGYEHRECVLAFIAVDRELLLKLLRPEIGWQA